MNIALFADIKEGKTNGPANSVTLLSKSLNEIGIRVDVYSSSKYYQGGYVNTVYVKKMSEYISNLDNYDIVVFEGVFRLNQWVLAFRLYLKNKDYVISPRSNLMKKSFKKSMVKKIFTFPIYYFYIKKSLGIHFLSEDELNNSFSFYKNKFVTRNGVSLNGVSLEGDASKSVRNKKILFVGRYDIYHKGLDLLLENINHFQQIYRKNNLKFSLYGTDYRNGKSSLIIMIEKYGIDDLVSVNGPVFGSKKIDLFSEYKFFLHFSRYEGQPQAVIESMAAGCQPLVTNYCNLNHVLNKFNTGSLIDENTNLYNLTNNLKIKKTKSLVEIQEYFNWNRVASDFIENLMGLKK